MAYPFEVVFMLLNDHDEYALSQPPLEVTSTISNYHTKYLATVDIRIPNIGLVDFVSKFMVK